MNALRYCGPTFVFCLQEFNEVMYRARMILILGHNCLGRWHVCSSIWNDHQLRIYSFIQFHSSLATYREVGMRTTSVRGRLDSESCLRQFSPEKHCFLISAQLELTMPTGLFSGQFCCSDSSLTLITYSYVVVSTGCWIQDNPGLMSFLGNISRILPQRSGCYFIFTYLLERVSEGFQLRFWNPKVGQWQWGFQNQVTVAL